MYFKKNILWLKKNNSTISVLQQWNILGLVDAFTKILAILSLGRGRHCALSLRIWILARLESLEFPMLNLNQVFNLLSVEKDLSASQLETGSVFTTFSMVNKFGNIKGFISCKASSRFVGMALLPLISRLLLYSTSSVQEE